MGRSYESLVNVSDEADERGDAGIFYTPRTEIDLMCRLALVDNLTNHLGETHKDLLYEVLFAFNLDDKAEADGKLAEAQLWEPLDTCLKALAVVDPACGSGSFLVGLLHILDDLRYRVNQGLGREESGFDRKKDIIGQNLYGVGRDGVGVSCGRVTALARFGHRRRISPAELHLAERTLASSLLVQYPMRR